MGTVIQFGKYLLLARLGKGGMAEVYKAVLTGPEGFEKLVALKVMHSLLGLEKDERDERALIDEARLCALLDHSNVVRVHEFGKYCGRYYLCMEYMDGWSVNQLLTFCREQRRWLPVTVAVEIMLMVCRGLQYAHAKVDRTGQPLRIVHRDLKPDNVMVSRAGEVKVMDFGIARATTQSRLTKTGLTRGTPTHMSPEQIRGEREELDQRSDIFALGIMLTELISFRLAFNGGSAVEVMHKILHGSVDDQAMHWVGERAPQLVPHLERCLMLEPEERYQTAADLARALSAAAVGLHGPSLSEWLSEVAPMLPGEVADGNWGADGPPNIPQPVELGDTPKVPPPVFQMPVADMAARLLSLPSMAIAPITVDGELVWEEVLEEEMPPAPSPPTEPSRGQTTGRRKRKRSGGNATVVVLGIGALLLIMAIVGLVVKSIGPTVPEQEPSQPSASPPEVEVELGFPPLPSLAVEHPTQTPTPTPRPTPRETVNTPHAVVSVVEPKTPEPQVELLVEPVIGTIKFNSVPWARITIFRKDGSIVMLHGSAEQDTPQQVELVQGEYTAQFRCGDVTSCGEQTSTVPFTVQEGLNPTVLNRF